MSHHCETGNNSGDNPEVLYEIEGHVAIITLNRPERMNTISHPMLDALTECFVRVNLAPEIRVAILTGKGDRAFCAGLDLSAQVGGGDDALLKTDAVKTHLDLRNTPPTTLFELDKPIICAMNGSAAGYGLDTALGCDGVGTAGAVLITERLHVIAEFSQRSGSCATGKTGADHNHVVLTLVGRVDQLQIKAVLVPGLFNRSGWTFSIKNHGNPLNLSKFRRI